MPKSNQTILVTGATGYIGEHVVKILCEAGQSPTLLCRTPENINKQFKKLPVIVADLKNYTGLLSKLPAVDTIIHLAGRTGAGHIEDPINDFQINALGTLNLLKAASEKKVKKFICTSSYEAIGVPQQLPIDEGHSCSPRSPYGASMRTREIYTQIFHHTYGMNTAILRIFNVYGHPMSNRNKKGVIAFLCDQMQTAKPVTLTAHPDDTKDFIHVEDVAQIICKASELLEGNGEIIHAGTGIETSLSDLANLMKKIFSYKNNIQFQYNNSPSPSTRFCANISQLKKQLNYKLHYPLKDGLQAMADQKRSLV